MKTLIICILAAVITTSNGLFFSGLFGHRSAPEEFVHHHHHVHEVVHRSGGGIGHQQPSAVVRLVHRPVAVHPQYLQVYKIVHEQGPQEEHGGAVAQQLGYGSQEGHGGGYAYQTPAHVITKVVQPVVNKNFIQSRHEHHYHHVASGPAHHNQVARW